MKARIGGSGRLRRTLATLALAAAAGLGLARCGSGGGDIAGGGGDHEDPDSVVALDPSRPADTLRIATLNMSIGFPVTQLVFTDMKDDTIAYDALDSLFEYYLRGYPGERVKAMARAIVAESLDVIGLQEVMAMRRDDSLVNDFLPELLAEIDSAGGPDFTVFQAVMNDTTLQGIRGTDTITITFREGHAVLVAPGFQVLDSTHIPYARANLLPVDTLGAYSERGTDYLRVKSPAGTEFQVFNTHLEVFGPIRNRQASQLALIMDSLAIGYGDGRHRLQVLVGDLNSEPGVEAHRILKQHGFADTWDGVGEGDGSTCCVNGSALWAPDSNIVDSRIDFVLARGLAKRLWSRTRVKETYTGSAGQKFLASDHRMVVSEFVAQ